MAGNRTGYRELSKNRDFTILWTGQTISDLGSQVSMFVFPLVTYALTGSAIWAAVIEAAFLVGLCGALLPGRRARRPRAPPAVMRAASGGGALLYASLAVAAYVGSLTIPHLAAVALLTGVATGISGPAEMSSLRSVVSREQLPTALSQSQARQHVASLLGGPLGGILYGVARWVPFAFDASPSRRRGSRWAGCGRTCPPRSVSARRASPRRTWPKASASSCPGRTSGRWPSSARR